MSDIVLKTDCNYNLTADNKKSLSEEAFARGIEMLNSILTPNMRIQDARQFDVYYQFLMQYSDEDFINGIELLIKEWSSPTSPPTVKTIDSFIKKAKFGLDDNEIQLVQDVYAMLSDLATEDKHKKKER